MMSLRNEIRRRSCGGEDVPGSGVNEQRLHERLVGELVQAALAGVLRRGHLAHRSAAGSGSVRKQGHRRGFSTAKNGLFLVIGD